ncbi:MAG: hypothetical protein ACD_62C00692G0006 [uncultured bacterium]|nr:MAG: hypothetical protein ACD_62C00692G0006 [uncultured bacterium]
MKKCSDFRTLSYFHDFVIFTQLPMIIDERNIEILAWDVQSMSTCRSLGRAIGYELGKNFTFDGAHNAGIKKTEITNVC